MQATLVHNPSAGNGDVTREALIDLLHRAGFTPFYQSTKVGHLTAALSRQADLVVVAGGDGTVTKVLTQMPDRSIPVGILPLGTANNIASSFGIGGSLEEIARGWHDARPHALDIGKATGPWGATWIVEGAGLGAMVRVANGKNGGCSRTERLEAARRALRKQLKKAEPDRVEVFVDDEKLPEEHLMVEILNIACGGPRLFLGPTIDSGDGRLDVLLLEPDARQAMREWLEQDEPSEQPPMLHRRGSRIRIAWGGTPLRIDDDFPSAPAAGPAVVDIELLSDSAKILVPPVDGQPGVPE